MITNGVTNARISTSTTHATRYTDTFRRYDNIYTLLIVGIGKTGQAIPRLAKALGMNTIGIRANPRPEPYVDEMRAYLQAVRGEAPWPYPLREDLRILRILADAERSDSVTRVSVAR